MRRVDVVVVGVGVMGAATGRALARAGREVLLLERFEVGHDRGSSHGAARIFRLSYHDPRYVRLAQESLPLWRELEAETGEALVTTTGGLDVGEAVPGHAAALAACGVRFERLDDDEARARFAGVHLPPGAPLLYQPDAGVVAADGAWRALVRSAVSHGAEVRERTTAVAIRPHAGAVEVRTEDVAVRARVAVVTAGAWARGLLAGAEIALPTRATRETVAYFGLPERADLPVVVEWGRPAAYSLPSGVAGLKTGEHQAGPEVDPDAEGPPDAASIARLRAWVRDRFPGADPEPHLRETCLYTNTADEHFVLERRGAVVIGSPCSGHGFKFAPRIGERLAGLAEG